MAHDPFATIALDPMEVDQDDLPSGSKGVMDGLQGSLRELEVVVRVADEHQVNGILGQFGRELVAQDRLDVRELALPAGLLDVAQKGRGNVHGKDLPLFADGFGELAGERPCSGPNVSDHHPRLELAGGDDVPGVGGNLSALPLELLDELLEVRVLKRLVDPRPNALLLGSRRQQRREANDQDGNKSREEGFHALSFLAVSLRFRSKSDYTGWRKGRSLLALSPSFSLVTASSWG